MNKRSPIKATNDDETPTPSASSHKRVQPLSPARTSPLASPRSSPRNFSEKRALFGKILQQRQMQQKLKAEQQQQQQQQRLGQADVTGDAGVIDSTVNPDDSGAKDKKILLPPRASTPRSSSQRISPKSSPAQKNEDVIKVPSDETEVNSTSSNLVLDEFRNSFPTNVLQSTDNTSDDNQLETISAQNIFTPKQPQCTESNTVMRAQSEEEFSEVFGGELKTIYSNDLTKRVLDKGLSVFQKKPLASDAAPDVGEVDSFDRESAFLNNDLNGEMMFDTVDSFERDILEDGEIERYDDNDETDVFISEIGGTIIDDDVESGKPSRPQDEVSVESFKSCNSVQEDLLQADNIGVKVDENKTTCCAEEVLGDQTEGNDQSIIVDEELQSSDRSTTWGSADGSRACAASGEVNVAESSSGVSNKVAGLEDESKFLPENTDQVSAPPSPTKSPNAQHETLELAEYRDEKEADDLSISYHSHSELSNKSKESSTSGAAEAPRASPIDPKLRRRHKMANRVASGKVNVPKSFLSAAATSVNKVAELENGIKITVEEDDLKPSPGKTPIQKVEMLAVHSPGDNSKEEVAKPNITAITTEQSVELHASLNELLDLSRDSGCTSQSFRSTMTDKGPLSNNVTPSHESSLEGHASILDTSDDSGKNLDKNEARRQRRQLRKRDVSTVNSSDEEKSSKDVLGISANGKCFGSVCEDEAKKLFPMPSFDDTTMVIPVKPQDPMSQLDCPGTLPEPAWDKNAMSTLDTILKQSKSQNCKKGEDGKPLLELDAVSSDAGENDVRIAAEKLMSQQKERMTMYTSGKGFGVGEDSSVELHESENEVDDSFDRPCEYQMVDDVNDNDIDALGSQKDSDFDFVEFGRVSHEEFSAASSAVQITNHVFDPNGDKISDIGKGSDFFDDTNSSTTGGGTVLGLRFIGSNDESLRLRPTPPGSPADIDATPRIGNKECIAQLEAVKEEASPERPKLPKIAPPPPEKLRQWEESKRSLSACKPPAFGFKLINANIEATTPKQATYPLTPKNTPPSAGHEKTPNLKISTPKSPGKKKPHSINEELNLSSHTKMAEKFAIASVKAAKKFEEKYSHIEHDVQYGPKSPERKGANARFFCAGDAGIPFIPSSNTHETEGDQHLHMTTEVVGPAVGELVGGAFSPWKIPDRAEEDSNASSSRILYDDESYAKASVAALNAIRGKSESAASIPQPSHDPKSSESVEVGLDWANASMISGEGAEEEGLLSEVLVWLFDEVLPSNAYSAFDIDTSTSVQARRVLAIANNDVSLNMICRHVTNTVIKGSCNAIGSPEKKKDFATEITNVSSSGDLSTSTCESSQVTSVASTSVSESKSSTFSERAAARILKGKKRTVEPFSIPVSADGGDVRPPGEMLAANFISFLQQISYLTGVAFPFDENPFLQSVVNLTTKKREHSKERKSMQELVFDSEDRIIRIFLFLKAACHCESRKESLTSIIENADDEDERVIKASHHSPLEWKESLAGDAAALQARLVSGSQTLRRSNKRKPIAITKSAQSSESSQHRTNLNLVVPKTNPSPFETAVWNDPSIMLSILSFLGNPVSVCVVKRLNVFCNRLVSENEHVLMRDAVRLGGMSKFVRPSFWLWVTMERCAAEDPIPMPPSRRVQEQSFSFNSEDKNHSREFAALKDRGAAGKWQHIIERDVLRAFGNMPPHKTGAKYRQDSIVRALVSFGKEEIMRNSRSYQAMDKLPEESEARHFKLTSRLDQRGSDDSSETPTDTVSDWGGISPVGR
jgi:hypothetical protein